MAFGSAPWPRWLKPHAIPDVVRLYPALSQSLLLAASAQLRNMATLGGNVLQRTRCTYFRDVSWAACNKRNPGSGCAALDGVNRLHAVLGTSEACIATYPGDWAQAMLALDATVEILGTSGQRCIPFAALHRRPGTTPHIETSLEAGDLITAFTVPAGPWTQRSLYLKIRDRQSYEFALASAAVALDLADGVVRQARIALGGVATTPWRAEEAEAILAGKPLDETIATTAAKAAFGGARTREHNAYKVALGQETLGPRADADRRTGDPTMSAAAPDPKGNQGSPVVRVEGRAKVTGEARYASDFSFPDTAYAFLLTSAIARGRIAKMDVARARAVRGVIEILTHDTMAGVLKDTAFFGNGGVQSNSILPLGSAEIFYAGQIIAVVLANSFEAAREGAYLIETDYKAAEPAAGFESAGASSQPLAEANKKHEDPEIGQFDAAFAEADVKVDARYATPTQHHNPIELFTTTCVWSGPDLTVYEPSQNVFGIKNGIAQQLGIDPAKVRVVSPLVGGAFGSKGGLTQRTALVAVAARRLNRPVKLVPTRAQGFTIATYRAETEHRVRLAASRDGQLRALSHDGFEVTSRPDAYAVAGTDASTRMYACANIKSSVTIVRADRATPGFMRAPAETPYIYALECAMDELAVALDMDPIELRPRQRHTEGADQRAPLHEPCDDGLFRPGRREFRVVEAEPEAWLHAGGGLARGLWLRHGLLSDPDGAGQRPRSSPAGWNRPGRDRHA